MNKKYITELWHSIYDVIVKCLWSITFETHLDIAVLFQIPRLSQNLCFLHKVDIIFMCVSIYQSRCSSNQLRSKDLSLAAIEFNESLKFNMFQLKMNPVQKEISELGNPTGKGKKSPRFDKGDEAELGGGNHHHFRLHGVSLSLSISQLRAPLGGWKSQALSFLGEWKIDADWVEVILGL